MRATYDGIINELSNEREEAVRIAQAYKSELDKVVISDDDIAHLHNTVEQRSDRTIKVKHLINSSHSCSYARLNCEYNIALKFNKLTDKCKI